MKIAERRPVRLPDYRTAVIIMFQLAQLRGIRSATRWGTSMGLNRALLSRWMTGAACPYAYQLWLLAESIDCDIVLVPRKPKPGD